MRDGVARWEIRADDIAGCLRTAGGGSSRQAVVEFERGSFRVRWMTPVEYARLMGAPDYKFAGAADSDAYSGFGDAVCVPVVEWIARSLIIGQMPSMPDLDQVAMSPRHVDVYAPVRA
jgi:DNA (cytosine-5)-methyltransferase 1